MRNLLLKFFEKVGKSQEIELFIQRFNVVPRNQFAVLRVSTNIIENQLDDIAESLAFMQHMGIYPVVILDMKTDSYSDATTPISDTAAAKKFNPTAERLIEALNRYGSEAEIVENIVDVTSPRPSNWTLDHDPINGVLNMDRLPIISPFGRRNRRRVFVNAEELSQLLVEELNPIKYILITEVGGILDENDTILPFLNLSQRKEWSHVKEEMKPIVRAVRQVLKKAPDCAAIFTSPDNLLKEIFTVKGSGTFVKKYSITATSKMADLDKDRLRALLEDAFRKRLVDDFFEDKIKMVLVEKNYEGVAIIKKIRGIPYLDKIAVAKTSEGTGLGRSLWQKVAEQYPKLVWRSTPVNPLSSFYLRECDGCMKFPKWIVYWRNLEEGEIFPIVKKILEIR
ncbi:hypothetical protein EBR57_08890, partial [bacterium]|nr:hypothetical protein [bacterium]